MTDLLGPPWPYPAVRKSGQFTCYSPRSNHVLATKPARAACGRLADLLASPGGRDAMTQGKRDKQFYEQRASDEMARHFLSADYDTRRKLALAGRMLAREEHESGLA